MQHRATLDLGKLQSVEADIAAGHFTAAAAAINELAASAPADPRLQLASATLARAVGNPQQELLSLQRAVAIAPKWPPARLELAKAHSRAGRHDEAIAVAEQAVQLAPQDMLAREVAVAIATAGNRLAVAERHLQAALTLRPGDIAISRTLAGCLSDQSRQGDAEPYWRAVLAQDPNDLIGLGGLGACLIGLGRKDEAAVVLQRALALAPDHPTLVYHLALARGETPRSQPWQISQALFDDYATRFDQHLVGELKYRVPQHVAESLRTRWPTLDIDVLDLGCGTGLLGRYLSKIGGGLVGVDVSSRMLDQARGLGLYTELRQSDLLSALRQAQPQSVDAIVANDVFIYVGDLSDIIPAAHRALRNDGVLIFSCESAEESEGDLVLRPSKRYAHSRAGVERLCAEAGFASCTVEPIDLRFDGGDKPIAGFIAIAQR